jgi:hypothetical protein
MYISAVPALAQFKQLTQLRLEFDAETNLDPLPLPGEHPVGVNEEDGFVSASMFLPHLQCSSLTQLSIKDAVFTLEETEQLCQQLPRLTQLKLSNVEWLSLSALRLLAQTLVSFELTPVELSEFVFSSDALTQLHKLQVLRLLHLDPPMDDTSRAQLTVPSVLLPSLIEFETK